MTLEEKEILMFVEKCLPYIPIVENMFIKHQDFNIQKLKMDVPQFRLKLYIHLYVMMGIIISILILSFYKIIDGSATIGIFGAMIGYVFGTLYPNKVV